MPVFAALVSSIFTALSGWFAALLGVRVAARVAAIASVVALAGVLVTLFNVTLSPMAAALFSTPHGQLLGLAFPPVAGSCMASTTALWMGCTLYKLKLRAVQIAATI